MIGRSTHAHNRLNFNHNFLCSVQCGNFVIVIVCIDQMPALEILSQQNSAFQFSLLSCRPSFDLLFTPQINATFWWLPQCHCRGPCPHKSLGKRFGMARGGQARRSLLRLHVVLLALLLALVSLKWIGCTYRRWLAVADLRVWCDSF